MENLGNELGKGYIMFGGSSGDRVLWIILGRRFSLTFLKVMLNFGRRRGL